MSNRFGYLVAQRQIIGTVLIIGVLLVLAYIGQGPGGKSLEIFVSKGGDDSWPGLNPVPGNSGSGPYATVERARDEVRGLVG